MNAVNMPISPAHTDALADKTSRRILIGVCGGIAAYKVVMLARLLQAAGHQVRVIGTPTSREFVGAATWEGITGLPFSTDIVESGSMMGHIHWPDQSDLYVIVPATANTIHGLAHGLSDSLVCTAFLAARCPVIVVPAMNVNMWQHAATQDNLARLRKQGVSVLGTASGSLACGWEGEGRMLEPADIAAHVERALTPPVLQGVRVTLTAGATREFMDPVRYVSNPSTGKMGLALAYAAWCMGAQVRLVLGQSARPYYVWSALESDAWHVQWVDSAEQMRAAVLDSGVEFDWYISAAAVSDYTTDKQAHKQKKSPGSHMVEFRRTTDILAMVGSRRTSQQVLVGFAAETHSIIEYAQAKLQAKNLDAIVYNDVSGSAVGGFGADLNAGGMLLRSGEHIELPPAPKKDFAFAILRTLLHHREQHKARG